MDMSQRIVRLGTFLLVLFLVLCGYLLYWQVIDATTLTSRPDNHRAYLEAARVHRGAIYDRNGVVLASTTVDGQGVAHRSLVLKSLASTVGYHSLRVGDAGLEAAYGSYLAGASGQQTPDDVRRRLFHEPTIGDNLHLTIDARIQSIAARALGGGRGVAIVADPRSGEILALVSSPGIDPDQIDLPGYWESIVGSSDGLLLNRAIQGLYPPGSTFKIVTLAAALQSGAYSLQSVFAGQQATGPLVVEGYFLPASINNLPYGTTSVTLQEALQYSDNIVFANVGLKLGGARLLTYAGRFGFGHAIPFDLPVARSSVTPDPASFGPLRVASSAFGQGRVLVTPLQMLLVTEAIATRGTLMRPYVVQSITAPDGETLKAMQPAAVTWGQAAVDAAHAAQVATAMQAVVAHGSGYAARIPGVPVAGKTGTAEVGNLRPHAWFTAFAPADNPRLAVVVLKENAGEGAYVAAPIAHQILTGALPLVT
ncbi:MAG: penicillin-binding transpeptidase domain-containing protein [Chloroflexota bacterium]